MVVHFLLHMQRKYNEGTYFDLLIFASLACCTPRCDFLYDFFPEVT